MTITTLTNVLNPIAVVLCAAVAFKVRRTNKPSAVLLACFAIANALVFIARMAL